METGPINEGKFSSDKWNLITYIYICMNIFCLKVFEDQKFSDSVNHILNESFCVLFFGGDRIQTTKRRPENVSQRMYSMYFTKYCTQ